MNKSARIVLVTLAMLAAMAFSAYGVVRAAPGFSLSNLLNDLGVGQLVSTETPLVTATDVEATETPEVEGTEEPEIEDETPEATEAPEAEENDDDICAPAPGDTTSLSSLNCSDGSSLDRDDDQGDDSDDNGSNTDSDGSGSGEDDGGSGGDD